MGREEIIVTRKRPAIIAGTVLVLAMMGFRPCDTAFAGPLKLAPDPNESAPLPETRHAYPPTLKGARDLLSHFLAPGIDHQRMTQALRPASDDYRGVFEEPLAGALEKANNPMWDAGVQILPKPGQTQLILTMANTSEIIHGKAQPGFPDGYAKVATFLKPGVPIACFKFVKPGDALGFAFDGLVYVNRHWVLMPKPWAAVK